MVPLCFVTARDGAKPRGFWTFWKQAASWSVKPVELRKKVLISEFPRFWKE